MDAILITGPTASGKSALAVNLAKEHGGMVVNADSIQVYDTLWLLTARSSEEDMQGVPHLLYGHVSAARAYSAGEWLREAAAVVDRLRSERRLPVFVGGTGLYFKALTGALADMPDIPADIRDRLRTRLLQEGPERLHEELFARDPTLAATLKPQDGQRIVRALEVLAATGRSITVFWERSGPVIVDPRGARKIVMLPERAVLHQRIERRFAAMLEMGAVEEVKALLALDLSPDRPAMKAIGVREIAAMLSGAMTRQEAIDAATAATRQYAKRQMTWFRNQMDESWERRV